MPNTTGNDRLLFTPWTTDRVLRLPAAAPATSTIFYGGQAFMRDVNGNLIQCDDTQKGEFIGIQQDFILTQVDPVDQIQVNGLLGDKMFDVVQPLMFMALIASAVAGDEGRKVYWQFNTTVSYSPGNNGNFAGLVWWVKDATHVLVVPPWMVADLLGSKANMALPATGNVTLTKFDAGKTFQWPGTAPATLFMPPAGKVGSGDQIVLIQTGAGAQQLTLAPAASPGTDTFNSTTAFGAATFALGTARGSRAVLQSDGVSQWFIVG